MKIRIVVPGEPQQWKRALSQGARRYEHPDCTAYKEKIRLYARSVIRAMQPLNVPCGLFVAAIEQYPKSVKSAQRTWLESGGLILKETTPDTDNFSKMIADSLQPIVITDDKIFSFMHGAKFIGKMPRCIIDIWTLGKLQWTPESLDEMVTELQRMTA